MIDPHAVLDSDRGWSRRVVVIVAALGVAFLVLSVVSGVVFHSSIDPTSDTFAVTLQNDTLNPVAVRPCGVTCRPSFDKHDVLGAGRSMAVNISSDDTANWWAATDPSGRVLGCWPMRYSHKADGIVLTVSAATRCPSGRVQSGGLGTTLGTIAAVGAFLGFGAIGMASIVFATIAVHRWLQRRGLSGGLTAVATAFAALVAFIGGWIVFDFWVVASEVARLIRRRPTTAI